MKFNEILILLVSKEFCDCLFLNKKFTCINQDFCGFRFPFCFIQKIVAEVMAPLQIFIHQLRKLFPS